MIAVRPPRDDHEVGRYSALRVQSYGLSPAELERFPVDLQAAGLLERTLVAADGDGEVLGGLVVLPLGQFWHGRAVPTGGIGGVVVAPERRGTGVGRALVRAACDAMRHRGEVLSILQPATMPVYRTAGWETAGDHGLWSIPAGDLAALAPSDVDVRRATDANHDMIRRVYLRAASAQDGMLARPAAVWTRRLAPQPGRYLYVAHRDDAICGYVVYSQHRRTPMPGYHLGVEDLAALDWDAERALWRHLGAHRAQVRDVHTSAPTTALAMHLAEQRITPVWTQLWMLRVVDAVGAVRARGFPAAVKLSVPFKLDDALVGDNAGAYVLEVADGHGELHTGTAASTEGPALTINGFAALYSGFRAPGQLVAAGMVRGGTPEQLDGLAAAFAGPRAVFNDDF